jgi:predicted branched-subunit amino acid permease
VWDTGGVSPAPIEASAPDIPSPARAFLAGLWASWTSVFTFVIIGTYVGVGALAHDYGFSLVWMLFSTVLVWAGPAQVIMISALGTGATLFEVALAVGLSGVRFLPMVVSLLPLLRAPQTRLRDLILPAHFTSASLWVESFRLLPPLPRERRIAFYNGLGCGFMSAGHVGAIIGFYLAALLPLVATAALLFLTPMSFLVSTARNSRVLVERVALGLGLVIGPLMAYADVGLDLVWSGLIAGSAAYGVHRLREALR